MRIAQRLLALCLTLSLTHCLSYDLSRKVVQQGNLLPESKIKRLKIGMSKEDAGILMGTSLMSPMFNQARWDYAYSLRTGSDSLQVKHLSLEFDHNRLTRVNRDSNNEER